MDEHKNRKGDPADSISVRVTDRRPRFDASPEQEQDLSEDPSPRRPSLVVELEERARNAESKLADALNLLRRRESEAEVFRTRLRKEMERRARAEMETWMKAMLEVMDSLDRGVSSAGESDGEALREGMIKVRDQCLAILARQGVEPMSLMGSPYDPHLAEAVAVTTAATPEDENRVVEEFRRGYTLGGQVLRPAQVRVARSDKDSVSDAGERSSDSDS
jgi:molecular chaperone GrpE